MPLLQTKFYILPLRLNQVRREHLIARLRDHGARRLTLISAPVGFGKTTLVNEWITQMGHAAAWLSLDEDDNDPIRFFTYLIAALQSCHEQIGVTAIGLLATPQTPIKEILTLLLNDLGDLQTPLALILDDYHVISAAVLHGAMTFFIEHLPPTLHLVIVSRIDPPLPLARWRAGNYLTELRADDLRFRQDESAAFLNEVMGLQLSASDIAALETRTEGWIAGLQLAALSLQGRVDRSAFIRNFSGSHRHVVSYLLEEVLNRQSDDTLTFLTQTAILDRMCGSLCEAVTGQADGFAMLLRLEQANLFIVPLDDEGQWYRYHHLFSQMLYARLHQTQAGAIAELHRRACVWCEEHGLLDEAMRHALAMPEVDLAVTLVESHAMRLLMRSELMLLHKWVGQLPSGLIQSRPRLALAQGWVLVMLGQLDAARAVLKLPVLQAAQLPAEVAGEVALLHTDIANMRRDPLALTWAQQALELLPLQRDDLRTLALLEIGLAYMRRGDLDEATQALQEVATRAEASENRFVAIDAYAALHSIQLRLGRLARAIQISEQALRMVARWAGPMPPATGMIYIGLGEILYEWNDLDGAKAALTQGLKLLQGTIEKMPLVRGHVARARVRQAAGDSAGALASLTQAEGWFVDLQVTDPRALARLSTMRARLCIQQGDLEAVRRWAAESSVPSDTLPFDTESACEHWLTLVRLWLAQSSRLTESGWVDQAEAALTAVRTQANDLHWPLYLVEERMLQALLFYRQGYLPAAMTTLTDSLALAEAGGFVRLFLDEGEVMQGLMTDYVGWIASEAGEKQARLLPYANKLLAAFSPIEPHVEPYTEPHIEIVTGTARLRNTPALLVEPLSTRELEVLQLIASGLSNSEVATRLIVTVGTVKSHVNHIFGKLAVVSRTQAIARARSLGLLTE